MDKSEEVLEKELKLGSENTMQFSNELSEKKRSFLTVLCGCIKPAN